jgi:cytochrome c-type biogenesis protein CcmH/NrfF
VFRDGREIDTLYPAKWSFFKHLTEPPTTEVAIRRTPAEDLYIVLAAHEVGTQAAHLQLVVNPLVNWVWLGFGVLALGTGIALLPERALSFAASRAAASQTATTTAALVLALLAAPQTVSAQHDDEATSIAAIVPRNDVERRLYERLVCLCGSCGKEPIGTCTCSFAAGIRREVGGLVDKGLSEDDAIAHLVAQYGSQELLGKPLDQGFNRLAWLFPYLIGTCGAIAVGVTAVRWSRRNVQTQPGVEPTEDPDLAERLDDELRNLD